MTLTETDKIFAECDRRGLTLEHGGDKLLVTPSENVTQVLLEKLRVHKMEILTVLESRKLNSARHLSKQILLGEFDGCDDAMRRTLAHAIHLLPQSLGNRVLKRLDVNEQ